MQLRLGSTVSSLMWLPDWLLKEYPQCLQRHFTKAAEAISRGIFTPRERAKMRQTGTLVTIHPAMHPLDKQRRHARSHKTAA